MGSSAQAISHQNLETASAIRTETITGSHVFTIYGYSLTRRIGTGKSINSDVFTIGGYNWIIEVFPDGYTWDDQNFISIYLRLGVTDPVKTVKLRVTFTILKQNGAPSDLSYVSPIWILASKSVVGGPPQFAGYPRFTNRTEFEASEYLKDDAFTVKCTITVLKGTKLEAINPFGIIVPPLNLNQDLANLLESKKGVDITFVVKGERITAHRCLLAARSAVFSAELFGCMKEKWIDTITVEDIEAPVFKSMLYFIYSDSLPDFEGTGDDNSEKQDLRLMTQHLLVAADRYQLERLRLMCEDLLCKNLDESNVATMLILAEQHNCCQLKAYCLKFISSPEVFKAVAQTDGFHNLIRICPALKDI